MSGLRQRRNVAEKDDPTNQDPRREDVQPDAGWSVFFKVSFFVFIILPTLCVLAVVLLVDSPIDPVESFEGYPATAPKLEGPLALNDLLVYQGQRILEGKIHGPESLIYKDGYLFTGTADGKILRIELATSSIEAIAMLGTPPCETYRDEDNCGRPLGMRFDKDGYLIVVDAYLGMYKINTASRDVFQLFPASMEVDGRDLTFLNDMDIGADGMIYFTQSSRYLRRQLSYDLLEGKPHGRFLRHDSVNNLTEVLLNDLYFANGVQISKDGSFVLVAETTRYRILKYHLSGPKQGQSEIFADNLPGTVDNIRRSSSGGFWAVLGICRHADRFNLMDSIHNQPWIRKQAAKLPLPILLSLMPSCGLIVELDKTGKIVRSLQDLQGERLQFMSEVEDHAGILYIGSFISGYIGRVDTFKQSHNS